ncbi:hypothetical protein G9A89_018323 [Geosiphon pyriformis]|nr:hypothetical protein G9A89_018323 [Geosiphon pyriformis]
MFLLTYPSVLNSVGSLNILESHNFVSVCNCLLQVDADSLSVYTDGSLSGLGTVDCRAGTAAFFKDINLDLGISVSDLILSTLVELQVIALALESVPSLSSVKLFSDSQSALNAYRSELDLACPDFCNQYWSYSEVLGNECANAIAGDAFLSSWYLPPCLGKQFIKADGSVVSENSNHFVYDIYQLVCHACWEVGSGSKFLANSLLFEVDWLYLSLVWHPNLHIATSFISRPSANAHTYFMKALHYQLPVAVQKCLYNRFYPSVLCLYYGDVEASDHVFSYKINNSV